VAVTLSVCVVIYWCYCYFCCWWWCCFISIVCV